MQEWVIKLFDGLDKTVIFVTHDIDEAIFLSDRIYVMSSSPGEFIAIENIKLSRPRSREITYVWQAFRNARALSDLKMHSNEFSLMDGINFFSDNVPNNWAEKNDDAVWWDIEETLRAPGHSTNYIVGKNMINQLMAERSRNLGSDFSLKKFFDEFMNGGINSPNQF